MKKISYNVTCLKNNKNKTKDLVKIVNVILTRNERKCYENSGTKKEYIR